MNIENFTQREDARSIDNLASIHSTTHSIFNMASVIDKFDELVVDFLRQTRFNIVKFKPEQLLVLKSFFSGRDVFAQLPKGYGKSLVFQCIPDFLLQESRM